MEHKTSSPPPRPPESETSLGNSLAVGGFLMALFLASSWLFLGQGAEVLLKLELQFRGTPATGRVEEVRVSKGSDEDPTYTHVVTRVEAEPHGSFTCRTSLDGYYQIRVGGQLQVLVHPTDPPRSRVDIYADRLVGPLLLLGFLALTTWFLGAALWKLILQDMLGERG